MTSIRFPEGFLWGAATSSFQIEGATDIDGRGESIWDRFAKQSGAIADGSDGSIACDHYQRYGDDVALMQELGLQTYRFSIAWPRIFPQGREQVEERGLEFYSRLVDKLLEAGITPYATLYHWDLPQALQDQGGWANRATAEAFAEFADLVTRVLGDRVKHWITLNEPWCSSFLSHEQGVHAPGIKDFPTAIATSHHLLLAHGLAVPRMRKNCPDAEIGITLNFTPAHPASVSFADREAARFFDGYFNRWFLDPLFGRGYPGDIVHDYQALGHLGSSGMGELVQPGDLRLIAVPLDFLGVNYYFREVLRAHTPDNLPQTVFASPPEERTDMGWEIYPEGLYDLLCRLHFEYRAPKLYITENGVSFGDGPNDEGIIADQRRIDFLREHLHACQRAITAGVPLKGYFAWSLMDNFEWDRGYAQRFGIVYVDYQSQQRLIKNSGYWYREVIRANGF